MSYQSLIDEAKAGLDEAISQLGADPVKFTISPARLQFGDLSCNAAFLIAKQTGQNPRDVAGRLAQVYAGRQDGLVLRAEAHPSGYLNFFADWPKLARLIIRGSIQGDHGESDIGDGQTITIEHTSVNPNKALHIGHARNIAIGDTLARIMRASGFKVNVLNYVDDSGLQVADIVLGFGELGFAPDPPAGQKFDHYCGDEVYVKTTKRYEQDPHLEAKRRDVLAELEDGSSETARLADGITRRVLDAQLETCWGLAAEYDCLNFESQIVRSGMWGEAFEMLKKLGLVEHEGGGKNAGCWVIRGKGGADDKVVVRSNGTATYVAKDIPYAAWKLGLVDDPFCYSKYHKEQPSGRDLYQTNISKSGQTGRDYTGRRVITVIDSRQSGLQRIISTLMDRFASPGAYVHLAYESVVLSAATAGELGLETQKKSAAMSGRHGLYINADTVLERIKERAREETARRNPDMDAQKVDCTAADVAIATIRYELVKQDLDKTIVFDMAKSMSLEGDTASYIQYGYARARRILDKAGLEPDPAEADYSLLDSTHERELVSIIGMLGLRLRDAAANLSPKVMARYCYELTVSFNGFYEHVRVLDPDNNDATSSRVCLVRSFESTLKKALHLIGVPAPYRM